MIAIIASSKVQQNVKDLNVRNLFECDYIIEHSVSSILKRLESNEDYTHAFIDIHGVKGNIDSSLDLVARLHKTAARIKIVVIAPDVDEEDALVRDIDSLGDTDIVLEHGAGLKKAMTEILIRDGVIKLDRKEERNTTTPPKEQPAAQSVPLASSVTYAAGKGLMERKQPIKPHPAGVTVAIAGGGQRVGTTTQAMQMALFLNANDIPVCVVQLFGDNFLNVYTSIMDDEKVELIGEQHYRINGLDLFTGGKAIGYAKANFSYVICDYGDYNSLHDASSFMDKDIKVMVCGIKPWEAEKLTNGIFIDDDNTVNYIFSFVPSYDYESIIENMGDSADKTFFAEYTPDYWQFAADGSMFEKILGLNAKKLKENRPKKKASLLGKLFKS